MKDLTKSNYISITMFFFIIGSAISFPLWYQWVEGLAISSQYKKEIIYKKALLESAKYDKRISKYKLQKEKLILETETIKSEIKKTAGNNKQNQKENQ